MGGARRALVADESPELVDLISGRLRALGWEVVGAAYDAQDAESTLTARQPDVVVVGVSESPYALDLVETLASLGSAPVIAALRDDDPSFVAEAAARGIAAFTSNLDAAGLEAAIEMALHRQRDRRNWQEQIAGLEHRLRERAQIEQAKGVLMERHGLADDAAYEVIRTQARSDRTTVLEVARAVLAGNVGL